MALGFDRSLFFGSSFISPSRLPQVWKWASIVLSSLVHQPLPHVWKWASIVHSSLVHQPVPQAWKWASIVLSSLVYQPLLQVWKWASIVHSSLVHQPVPQVWKWASIVLSYLVYQPLLKFGNGLRSFSFLTLFATFRNLIWDVVVCPYTVSRDTALGQNNDELLFRPIPEQR
jgi:hypothetical protein